MKPERISDAVAYHAEGPIWWPRLGMLRFVDMFAGEVLTMTPGGEVYRTSSGAPVVAALRPRVGGGAIIARGRDIAIAHFDDLHDVRSVASVDLPANVRFNEGGCDPEGRFYAGTMSTDGTPGLASLYQFDIHTYWSRPVVTGLSTANGVAWSPDTSTMYLNDTPNHVTWAFDYDPLDGLSNRRVFVQGDADSGRPDGMCVDVEGGVWIALNRKGTVHRYDPSGALSQMVTFPVSQVTACTFGGTDFDVMFCTSSRENLPGDAEPEAGSIWSFDPGISGLPPALYIG